MIKPSAKLIYTSFAIASISVALAIARIYWPSIQTFVLVLGAISLCIIALMILDAFSTQRVKQITALRVVNQNLPVGKKSTVELQFHNPNTQPIITDIIDHLPAILGKPQQLPVQLNAKQLSIVRYSITPIKRGDARFEKIELNAQSKLGFWTFRRFIPIATNVKVYPDFASILQLAGLEYDQKAAQMGIHIRQRRGEGMDFRQLREFRQGDSLRGVDWKATSRMGKLIARDYQDERDQEILFLLDTGRRLHSKDGELSHFDYSLNAVILLAFVALNKGDKIGLRTFSGDNIWMPPMGGKNALPALLRRVYGLHSSLEAPDYLSAATKLLSQQKRRALIVLISNFNGEESGELYAAIKMLKRKHIVVAASLRENYLDNVLQQPTKEFVHAIEYAGACEFLNDRNTLMQTLRTSGVHLIDTPPTDLAKNLVNQYLSLKRSGVF